jgi:glycosidase
VKLLIIISFSILSTFALSHSLFAQVANPTLPINPSAEPRKDIYQIVPPHWYVGFKDTSLEIILHAENIDLFNVTLAPFDGVTLVEKKASANRHICYLTLNISPKTKPGTLVFNASAIEKQNRYVKDFIFSYELRSRTQNLFSPISPSDVTYLIFPDRFCNGDKTNDNVPMQYNEPVDRKALKKRHGGDIAGIKSKLNYLKDLGITTLWLNPVQENDQPEESFHGYAITDHYKIDPRFGSNSEYLSLNMEMKKMNMKMIMDIIPNHVGHNHWMYQNFDTGWFNLRDSFVQTNFRATTIMDPYASQHEKAVNVDGAFVKTMPDYNQKNPHVVKYLNQLYLWWIEYAGLSGYRIDTYPYPDQNYMNDLCQLILSEYPKFTIYGETWVQTSAVQAAFTKNNIKGYEKNQLPGVTDFVLSWAMQEAGNKPFGWTDGLNKVYLTLIDDYLYQDPNKNCTFLDNHDLSRIFSVVNEDFNAWKRCQLMLLTLRGLPCIYYGTEILMTGTTKESDAYVRFDFPGGWAGDEKNKFKQEGRTPKENEAFNFIRTLSKYRQSQKAISEGKTTQFSGVNGIYTYFRYKDGNVVMCIFSQNNEKSTVDLTKYSEMTKGFSKLKNIITGEIIPLEKTLNIEAQGSMIFELAK